ncbi:hypothetical protein [Arthrobacter sp. UM1]|uniref:DMP19 family protein n=1 Tax=Arthrobacter sp. UM1 TaxID=2766776 RepID=UPI001CF64970|nr:hypothetical protein [Arthrobacter sp. UM1]MCB4208420.1 hypothetical protein [Arthrobacter sp. UM1]
MSQVPESARHVIVSEESLTEDADAVLLSNMNVVNTMFDEHIAADEIADAALESYYVDFYATQLAAGGFGHLVFTSAMDEDVLQYIADGLDEMGAEDHLELFKKFVGAYENLGEDGQEYFLTEEETDDDEITDDAVEDDYSDDDEETDAETQGAYEAGRRMMDEDDEVTYAETGEDEGAELGNIYEEDLKGLYEGAFDELDEAYEELSETRDLTVLNAAWLKSRPDLRPLPAEQIDDEVSRLASEVPGIDERRSAAEADIEELPEHEALIMELVDVAGQDLEEIQGRDSDFAWEGMKGGWRFTTNEGAFIMVDDDDHALMVSLETNEAVAELEFEEE